MSTRDTERVEQNNRRWGAFEKLTLLVISPVLAANMSVLGWACSKVNALDLRMAKVESQIFTPEQRADLTSQISVLSVSVARLAGDQPPAWFVRRLDQMESTTIRRLDGIDIKIEKLGERIGTHLEGAGAKP
jgi:hypothetical protein